MTITHETFGSSNPGQKEIPQMTKGDLFQLLELGRVEDEIQIGEVLFKLRTLSAIELSSIYKEFGEALANMEGKELSDIFVSENSNYLKLSSTILAYAVVSVNGIPLEEFVDAQGEEDVLKLKKNIIANFQWPIIHSLMGFYNQLTGRAGAEFGEELKK